MPFFDPFWASVGPSSKIAKVPRCFKNKHLGAFQASEAIFFEGLLSQISEPKKRSDVTYIMVSAIFCFRKKAPSGRKKYLFYSDSG